MTSLAFDKVELEESQYRLKEWKFTFSDVFVAVTVVVSYTPYYMLNSRKRISLIYVRQFSWISVHLRTVKISARSVVSHFLSAEVSPEIMEIKINPGFRTEKKCPFPLNRGHSSLQEVIDTKIMCTFSGTKFCVP